MIGKLRARLPGLQQVLEAAHHHRADEDEAPGHHRLQVREAQQSEGEEERADHEERAHGPRSLSGCQRLFATSVSRKFSPRCRRPCTRSSPFHGQWRPARRRCAWPSVVEGDLRVQPSAGVAVNSRAVGPLKVTEVASAVLAVRVQLKDTAACPAHRRSPRARPVGDGERAVNARGCRPC